MIRARKLGPTDRLPANESGPIPHELPSATAESPFASGSFRSTIGGQTAAISRFTPLAAHSRRRLLLELICVDLEFRWRSSCRGSIIHEPHKLERYAARFPELGSLDQLPLELIAEEYRVRRIWGDRPIHQGYFSRFPAREEEIRKSFINQAGVVQRFIGEARTIAKLDHPN